MAKKSACIEAYHEMEERYAMLEMRFFTKEQSDRINEVLVKCIKEYEVSPDIIVEHDNSNNDEGIYIVEFHDDYNKESGDFFECVIDGLDIKSCIVD